MQKKKEKLTMAETIQKNYDLRKILKQVVEESLDEATAIIPQDSREDKAEILYSYQETLNKKLQQ